MENANGYQVLQEGRATHVNPGNADDWLYATLGTAPFTFEVGLDFNSQNAKSIGAVEVFTRVRDVQAQIRGAQLKWRDRKSTRLNSSHLVISYAVFCLKKKIRHTYT